MVCNSVDLFELLGFNNVVSELVGMMKFMWLSVMKLL